METDTRPYLAWALFLAVTAVFVYDFLVVMFDFKGGTYPGTGGTCGTTLPSGASCTFVITYVPTTTGMHTDSAEINYDDGVGANIVVLNLQGTGENPAMLFISDPAVYDFGSVPTLSTGNKIFTVTNAGNITATAMAEVGLTAPFEFDGGFYPGAGGTCTSSAWPRESISGRVVSTACSTMVLTSTGFGLISTVPWLMRATSSRSSTSRTR